MTKVKKTGAIFLAAALLIGVLWFYWEYPVSLGSRIPEATWVKVELRQEEGAATGAYIEFLEPPLDEILTQLDATRVTRMGKDRLLDGKYFQLLLYKGEAYPTMLYVEENGQIHVAAELDFDHWKNYEGGKTLYSYLSNLSQRLSAVYPAK